MNNIFISQPHGCVYAIAKDCDSDGDYLIQTPILMDNTYDHNQDNWDEVDEMALLGEEQHIRDHIDIVWATLKMTEDTPMVDIYGG